MLRVSPEELPQQKNDDTHGDSHGPVRRGEFETRNHGKPCVLTRSLFRLPIALLAEAPQMLPETTVYFEVVLNSTPLVLEPVHNQHAIRVCNRVHKKHAAVRSYYKNSKSVAITA